MSKKPLNKKELKNDKRLAVAPISREENAMIQQAKTKLGMTRPWFYRMAILDKAREVIGGTYGSNNNQ